MKSTIHLPRILAALAVCLCQHAPGDTLFTSGFDGNTGAYVFAGATDNTNGSASLAITDWVRDLTVTSLSGLTAISTDDGVSTGGFAQMNNGTNANAGPNNVFLSRNLNAGTLPRKRGFSLTFTLGTPWDLATLTVLSGHANGSGGDQSYLSDLVFHLSGGDLAAPVTATSNQDYAVAPIYHTVAFDLSGTTLGAGTYTLEIYQTNLSAGGAYAIYNGITLAGTATLVDTDADGLADPFEQTIIDFDPNDAVTSLADVMGTGAAPANTDFDGDGSDDGMEFLNSTNPTDPDTDHDGFHDGAETNTGSFVSYNYLTHTGNTGTDPLDPDTDNDTLPDGVESGTTIFVSVTDTGTDPNNADTDLDELLDAWEIRYGLDPNHATPPNGTADDPDEDTLTNLEEQTYGTNPKLADTDADGVKDDVELFTDLTNPLIADVDADGLNDGAEKAAGTSPFIADTDGDLFLDGPEVAAGSDPLVGTSVPDTVLLTSNFDANTGAVVLAGNTDNTSGSSALGVTWIQRAPVSAASGLTAISEGDGGTLGGFAQLQDGAAIYAGTNNAYLSRNHNLDTDRTTSKRGYSFTFTVAEPLWLGDLIVRSGHTTNTGTQDQYYTSDLAISLSGGTLGAPVTRMSPQNYDLPPAYHNVVFDLTGTTLGAGSYTLTVYQTNMTAGGAYAIYDGLSLMEGEPVPAPLQVISSGFNGAAFELQVTGFDLAKTYVLKRSENLMDGFPSQIGEPFTPTSVSQTVADPAPTGAKAFYRIEMVP